MRLIKVDKIISVSSQDNLNPVENILNETNLNSKWLSSPKEKVQHIEAEFQLEEAVAIRCIELGNYGSSSIEILARNSCWPSYKPHITLLPAATLRTLEDTRKNSNFDVIKSFTEEQFGREAVGKKFDQIKVICGQPYTEPFQYGLSFLHFKADNVRLHYTTEDFYSGQSIPPLFKRIIGNHSPKTYLSRGRQMVDAALTHNSFSATSSALQQSSQENGVETSDFSLQVILFLTDPNSTKRSYSEISVNEMMKLFERKNDTLLTVNQKDEFCSIHTSLFSQASIVLESKSSSTENFSTPVNNSFSSASSSSRKRGKHIPSNRSRINDESDLEKSTDCSFDVGFTPRKKARSCQKNLFGDGNTSSSSPSHAVITIEDDETPCASGSSSFKAEDFVQSDGSVPSTSRALSFVDCPICSKEFHVSDIEKHAATCENFKLPTYDSDEDDEDKSSASYNQTVYYSHRYGTKC